MPWIAERRWLKLKAPAEANTEYEIGQSIVPANTALGDLVSLQRLRMADPSFVALVEVVPLRLLVVTNNPELAQGLRFGNAVPNVNADDGPAFPPPSFLAGPEGARIETQHNRPPCIMRKMRDKAIEISNSFRTALGLPLIEAPNIDVPKEHHGDPVFRILPFIGTPPTFVKVEGEDANGASTGVTKGGDAVRIVGPDHDGNQPPHPPHHPHKHHKHGKHHKHHKCRKAPFFRRLTIALMTLGPWEGRAVAFVLGTFETDCSNLSNIDSNSLRLWPRRFVANDVGSLCHYLPRNQGSQGRRDAVHNHP